MTTFFFNDALSFSGSTHFPDAWLTRNVEEILKVLIQTKKTIVRVSVYLLIVSFTNNKTKFRTLFQLKRLSDMFQRHDQS